MRVSPRLFESFYLCDNCGELVMNEIISGSKFVYFNFDLSIVSLFIGTFNV